QALRPGEDSRSRRDLQEAHRQGTCLQRRGQIQDRSGRRFLPHSGALMLRTIANAFSVADIRKKIAFTAAMLLLYRLGAYIPAPGVDIAQVKELEENFGGGGILNLLNSFSGGSL